MKQEIEPNEFQLKQWHDDPNNWKLGIFYYNSKDNRLFPPKRFYGGWTVNFANPYSLITMIAVIALIIVVGKYFLD